MPSRHVSIMATYPSPTPRHNLAPKSKKKNQLRLPFITPHPATNQSNHEFSSCGSPFHLRHWYPTMPPPGAPAQIFDREPERRSRSPSGRHCVRSEVYLCGCCANGKRHCVWGMSVLESICRTLSVPESMETLHSALEFGCSTKDHCIDEAAQHGDHVRGTLSLIFYAHAAATRATTRVIVSQ